MYLILLSQTWSRFPFFWRKRWCEFRGPRLLLRRFKDFDQVQRLGNRHAIPGTRKPTSFKWMEMVQQPEKLLGFAQLGISAGCFFFFCVWNVQISLIFFEFVGDLFICVLPSDYDWHVCFQLVQYCMSILDQSFGPRFTHGKMKGFKPLKTLLIRTK